MLKKHRQFSAEFKFRVALAAAKETHTLSELAKEYGIHPNQISKWKRQLLEEGASVFSHNGAQQQRVQAAREAELYEQIGRLQMELEWLGKKVAPFR